MIDYVLLWFADRYWFCVARAMVYADLTRASNARAGFGYRFGGLAMIVRVTVCDGAVASSRVA